MPESNGPAPYDMWEIPNVIVSRTCLLPMVTDESIYLIRMFGHYKNNLLVISGGILNQPNKYITAMEIIDNYLRSRNANATR